MNCPNCAAPLQPETLLCAYCGSRQDVDLQGWACAEAGEGEGDLHCPDGHGPLEHIDLGIKDRPGLDRCSTCLGLFLRRGVLQQLLSDAVGPVWEVNRALIQQLIDHPRQSPGPMRYRPCPSCGDRMNRRLFGKRSGVIVDRCRAHGTWLDAGELRQLLEWTRAGGGILHQERQEEQRHQEERRKRLERRQAAAGLLGPDLASERASQLEDDVLMMLAQALQTLRRRR